MDEIFNVKFIERAMQLKAMVDCQIMAIHPHMVKIIAFYDLLIYRYYSPVWNRNAEGKLQTPEKKEKEVEEEKDEGDDDDDDDDGTEKKGKDELDTGGLERGEGVEIVVFKVFPKKKNKNENDEEEEEEEKEKNDGFKDEEKGKKKKSEIKTEF